MKKAFILSTCGDGFWSRVSKNVTCTAVDLSYMNSEGTFGELRVSFDTETWNNGSDGLIYTDSSWLMGFRKHLVELGFSKEAANDANYSEQGMQGSSFVSLDVGKLFIKEWDGRSE